MPFQHVFDIQHETFCCRNHYIFFPEMPEEYIMRRKVSWKWCWSGRVEWNADPSMFLWDAKWKEAWFAFTEFVTEIPVSISRHSLLFPQQNLSSRSIWHPQTLPSSQIHKPQSAWIFDICRWVPFAFLHCHCHGCSDPKIQREIKDQSLRIFSLLTLCI